MEEHASHGYREIPAAAASKRSVNVLSYVNRFVPVSGRRGIDIRCGLSSSSKVLKVASAVVSTVRSDGQHQCLWISHKCRILCYTSEPCGRGPAPERPSLCCEADSGSPPPAGWNLPCSLWDALRGGCLWSKVSWVLRPRAPRKVCVSWCGQVPILCHHCRRGDPFIPKRRDYIPQRKAAQWSGKNRGRVHRTARGVGSVVCARGKRYNQPNIKVWLIRKIKKTLKT